MTEQGIWDHSNFYVDGVHVGQEEHISTPLQIGDGLIYQVRGESLRLRVVDVWYSHDHHGRFDIGRHVFFADVTWTEDDLPGRLEPEYFGN